MQSIEMEIGEAKIKVSPETVRDRIILQSITVKALQCQDDIERDLQIPPSDHVRVMIYNYCQISTRVRILYGRLSIPTLHGTDSHEDMVGKILQFIDSEFLGEYSELIKAVNRIDRPEIEHLAPGSLSQYQDIDDESFEALPEVEKKR